ncbi:hypothetical protein BG011_001492 [Mortierella polycephala]|uniref:Attractin/MKLN-like beta-propeller domain-containing protein n=1 Tax=Mortierella polycephala TaxID=41804 RepID=A0A9P6UAK9_9FUNG|nr:hypothetical protein BG011_001492 [Mortierella polycephala]
MRITHRALVILGAATTILSSIQAQSQPQSCGGTAFAKIGSKFYIQGGSIYADNLLQSTWELDLASPWSISNPAWKSLPAGPYNAFHSAGYSSDNSTFITFGRDTAASSDQTPAFWLNSFDIATSSWKSWNPPSLKDTSRRDFYAVTNPAANRIYIIGGDSSATGATVTNDFDTYDPSTRALTEVPMAPSGPQNISTYAAVWIPRLSGMLVIGGQISGVSPQSLWIYYPETSEWATQSTSGSFSHGRTSHCAAANADGSLVAVYGGFTTGSSYADSSAYILDTRNWTWTSIQASVRGRGNTACAIVDDTFLIWGGFYDKPSKPNGVPVGAEVLLLLTLSTGTWKTTYAPSASMPEGEISKESSGLSSGAIGGIVGGVAGALLIGGLLVFWRYKTRHAKSTASEVESGGAAGHDGSMPKPRPCSQVDPSLQPLVTYSTQYSPQPMYPGAQPGYDQQSQYQQQYLQPSPNTTEAQHNMEARNTIPSPTTTQYTIAGEMPQGGVQYYQPTYPLDAAATSSIYYPPPPTSLVQQQQGVATNESHAAVPHSSAPDQNECPDRIPAGDGYGVDQYHDSYSLKHASMISDGSAVTTGQTRPAMLHGPQGGAGFGSDAAAPGVPGAPQAIVS